MWVSVEQLDRRDDALVVVTHSEIRMNEARYYVK